MLAAQINKKLADVVAGQRSSLDHACSAGHLLLAAKWQMDRGLWAVWVETNCSISARTAATYMRIAAHWDVIRIRFKTLSAADSTITKVMKLLAKPSARKIKQEPPQSVQPVQMPSISGGNSTPQVGRVSLAQFDYNIEDLDDAFSSIVENSASCDHWEIDDRQLRAKRLIKLKGSIDKVVLILEQPPAPVTPKMLPPSCDGPDARGYNK